MNLREQFETETKQGIYNTEGEKSEENNWSFNDSYVEWLEYKVIQLNVGFCAHLLPNIISEFIKHLKVVCPDNEDSNKQANDVIIKSIEILSDWIIKNNY